MDTESNKRDSTMKNNWKKLEDSFEERVAILEHDAGYSLYEAEQHAAQGVGFKNKSALKIHIQELKSKG